MNCEKHGAMLAYGEVLVKGERVYIWRCMDGFSVVGGENKGYTVLVAQEKKLCEKIVAMGL